MQREERKADSKLYFETINECAFNNLLPKYKISFVALPSTEIFRNDSKNDKMSINKYYTKSSVQLFNVLNHTIIYATVARFLNNQCFEESVYNLIHEHLCKYFLFIRNLSNTEYTSLFSYPHLYFCRFCKTKFYRLEANKRHIICSVCRKNKKCNLFNFDADNKTFVHDTVVKID